MKPILFALALTLAPRLSAMGEIPAFPGTHDLTLAVGETERTWRLHVPASYKKGSPLPLVVALHGMGGTGAQMERMTGFSGLAEKKGFAVAYPDGANRIWRYWDVKGGGEDTAFVGAVVDALVGAGVADARRVYVTGISNGAYMANHLACVMGDRIAAIAPVAGTFLRATMGATKAPRAMPVVYFHGTADRIVGYDGTDFISRRDSSLGAEELVAWWAKTNGCEGEAEVTKVEDRADDGTTVERREWKGGKAPVVFYRVEGGGHTWPGMPAVAERLLGKSTQDIEASEVIWEFFSKQSLRDPADPK